MSVVICIVLISWFVSALIRSSEAKKQEKRMAKIKAEQNRQKAELRQQREDAKEWARQQVEMQREQIRLAKEQERQAREIEKHEAMLIKHEAQINDLYYKMEKAEDEIVRFSEVLESLIEEKTEAEEELAKVKKALSAEDIKDEIRNKESKNNKNWRDASGHDADALRYMDACADDIGDTRTPKQRASDRAKLEKKAETLKGKIKKHDNDIFKTEQRIKKAEHDKYAVTIKLREVA